MCINLTLKVAQKRGDRVVMEDGREVRIGLLKEVQIGDYLEVYGDLALGKFEKDN